MPYKDKEKRKEAQRRYRQKPERRAQEREASKRYRETHLEERKAYEREYRQRPEIKEKDRLRMAAYNAMRRYGLTLEEYRELLNGSCSLCPNKAVAIDHCHITGIVRGALCNACNTGLGKFGDDPKRLRAAAKYLESNDQQ